MLEAHSAAREGLTILAPDELLAIRLMTETASSATGLWPWGKAFPLSGRAQLANPAYCYRLLWP